MFACAGNQFSSCDCTHEKFLAHKGPTGASRANFLYMKYTLLYSMINTCSRHLVIKVEVQHVNNV